MTSMHHPMAATRHRIGGLGLDSSATSTSKLASLPDTQGTRGPMAKTGLPTIQLPSLQMVDKTDLLSHYQPLLPIFS